MAAGEELINTAKISEPINEMKKITCTTGEHRLEVGGHRPSAATAELTTPNRHMSRHKSQQRKCNFVKSSGWV